MNKEEQVYNYLLTHCQGKENLIKNKELMNLFDIHSDKAMRKVIQNIREDKRFRRVVGSVSGKRGGNYICVTDEEIQDTIENIKNRANQMLRMTHILKWKKNLQNNYTKV